MLLGSRTVLLQLPLQCWRLTQHGMQSRWSHIRTHHNQQLGLSNELFVLGDSARALGAGDKKLKQPLVSDAMECLVHRLQPAAGAEQRAVRAGRQRGADGAGPGQFHAHPRAGGAPVPRGTPGFPYVDNIHQQTVICMCRQSIRVYVAWCIDERPAVNDQPPPNVLSGSC